MQPYSNLIDAYRASAGDTSVVAASWQQSPLSPQQLGLLAEEIGASYLSGQLTYSLANGLMNQLMPLAGWEQAPQRFWQFYVAFEDSETLAEPDPQARLAVQAALNAGAA